MGNWWKESMAVKCKVNQKHADKVRAGRLCSTRIPTGRWRSTFVWIVTSSGWIWTSWRRCLGGTNHWFPGTCATCSRKVSWNGNQLLRFLQQLPLTAKPITLNTSISTQSSRWGVGSIPSGAPSSVSDTADSEMSFPKRGFIRLVTCLLQDATSTTRDHDDA